ncbi:MAG: sulfite oxidase-like oxidoreductase [Rhodospirillaceae bacterium]
MADGPDDEQDDDRFAELFAGKPGSVLGGFRDPEPTPDRRTLVEAKERWAREGGKPGRKASDAAAGEGAGVRRLPPGQHRTEDWPVLDLGHRPAIDARDWRLAVAGLVERPIAWGWDAFLAQPQTDSLSDIHCVTDWSRYDNRWQGVTMAHLLSVVRPLPEAQFCVVHGYDGYTTNLTMARLRGEGVMLAHAWEGAPLAREHGGPVRLVIPELYFWKSAKWIRHMMFMDADTPGYWEARGYHNEGDPWKEERYE